MQRIGIKSTVKIKQSMPTLLHDPLLRSAERAPDKIALIHKKTELSYATLAALVCDLAGGLISLGLPRQQRVAIYLPKCPEGVAAMYAASLAGGVFVPVNPLLKGEQVAHIINDCNVHILVTSKDRLEQLDDYLAHCKDLRHVVVLDTDQSIDSNLHHINLTSWESVTASRSSDPARLRFHQVIDEDMTSIFYTSGSTGKPKGVILSHKNMVAGAQSVAQYIQSTGEDRLLAVLPFSFDYGFSQLSVTFHTCATVALMDYLFPKDVINALEEYEITALAGVPPLWIQLVKLNWPQSVANRMHYITNSGGAMPRKTLGQLRRHLPSARVYLMYGLTEAFRSTYLDPDEVDRRPDSIGKAIPNAEITVINAEGECCRPGEPGELVHAGQLVSLGYWNDPEETAHRFRPAPGQDPAVLRPKLAVWSGDTVTMDEEGYLYFVGRQDDMIKTSGYRVSPTEVEEAVYESGLVAEAIAIGVPHPELGQAIVVAGVAPPDQEPDEKALLEKLSRHLPNFMVPTKIAWRDDLPRNPNGKIDRKSVQAELADTFQGSDK